MSGPVIPDEVLRHWSSLAGASTRRIDTGLINETFRVSSGGTQYILQCLHPVFEASVNRDIEAVTEHLHRRGLTTPRILRCDDGALYCEHDNKTWRLLSYVPGITAHAVTNPTMAREAGRIAAQFHTALSDFDYEYRYRRGHVHDTPEHLARLRQVLSSHADHRLHARVEPLARRVLETTEQFDEIDALPLRHCHGDLKISNIVFDDDWKAVCLIDLDTVNRMAWPLEMGDALRSWCNPRTEDQLRANLDLEVLDQVLAGYGSAAPGWLEPGERSQLIAGLARICLELSARFLIDALRETYFGWDDRNYPTRGDHNLARGRAMAALYDDVVSKRAAAQRIVDSRLSPSA